MRTKYRLSNLVLFCFLTIIPALTGTTATTTNEPLADDGQPPRRLARLTLQDMTFIPKAITQTSFVAEQRLLMDKECRKGVCLLGILLFDGSDLISTAIGAATASPSVSHVGLCLVNKRGDRFCIESKGTAGQVLRGIPPQVQISPLDAVVNDYSGTVRLRKLLYEQVELFPGNNILDRQFFEGCMRESIGAPYETKPSVLLGALAGKNGKESPDDGMFCTEYALRVLQSFKIIDLSTLPDNCLPGYFVRDDLPWSDRYSLLAPVTLPKKDSTGCNCCIC